MLPSPTWANDEESYEDSPRTRRYARLVQDEVLGSRAALAARTSLAIRAMLFIACHELRKKGFHDEADKIQWEWNDRYERQVERAHTYDIGDFPGLSVWLSATFLTIELALGPQLTVLLHLDDLFVLNHTLPYLFRPCELQRDDFIDHMHGDRRYHGAYPTLTFWAAYVGTAAATAGSGLLFGSALVGIGAEWVSYRFITKGLSERVWDTFCTKEGYDAGLDF